MRGSLSDLYRDLIQIQSEFARRDKTRSYKNVVGDIGEHFACEHYGLTKNNGKGYDAISPEGVTVEIKTRTNANGKVEIKKDVQAQLLLVMLLDSEGNFEEIFLGPMNLFFENARYVERSNDYQVTIQQLKNLNVHQHNLGKIA